MHLSTKTILRRSFRGIVITLAVSGLFLNASNLKVRTAVIPKGETAASRIEYVSHGSSVAGLQFDLKYDRSALTIDIAIGSAAAAAGKVLSTNVLENGDIRIAIVGFNKTTIGNGGIVDLTITVNDSSRIGQHNLQFLNIAGVTPDGDAAPISAQDDGQVIAIR